MLPPTETDCVIGKNSLTLHMTQACQVREDTGDTAKDEKQKGFTATTDESTATVAGRGLGIQGEFLYHLPGEGWGADAYFFHFLHAARPLCPPSQI